MNIHKLLVKNIL